MTRAEQAERNFLGGMTCSQAVLMAFSDLTAADKDVLLAISRPFGGGTGRLRLTCGGFSGGVMAIGLLFPDLGKSELYALVQEYARRYTAENGSVICGELLKGAGLRADSSPNAEPRTEEYYRKRPCPKLVASAARLLEELCAERGIL